MPELASVPQGVILALQALILFAALQDAAQLRISNLLSVAIVACFGAWLIVVGPDWSVWQNVVAFIVALAIGVLLFGRGLLGGGDVKLLAALALWFDLGGALAFAIYTAIAGGILALALMGVRRMLPAGMTSDEGWLLLRRRGPIPYGLAIASGALLAIQLHGVNPLPLSALQRLNEFMPMPG
jgi:prepilin peptidase CpaA